MTTPIPKVLVVDDETFYIDVLVELLSDDYKVIVAKNGEQALQRVEKDPPDLILLDWVMPGLSGLEVCYRLKSNPKTEDIPIIFLTVRSEVEDEVKGFECGAIDYIRKPMSPPIVKARVRTYMDLYLARRMVEEQKHLLEKKVKERIAELDKTKDVAIHCLASLAETRDNETGYHIMRTQNYVKLLAQELAKKPDYHDILNDQVIDMLFKSAPLHDIGKVGIPDKILNKPGKLDADEWAQMKQHTVYGEQALKRSEDEYGTSEFLRVAKEISLSHHERWDGKGYPQGLAGEEIPLSGRIMAIADVYDALISKRVYKEPFSHEEAVQMILQERGTHFDPAIVDVFEQVQDQFLQIAEQYKDKYDAVSKKVIADNL